MDLRRIRSESTTDQASFAYFNHLTTVQENDPLLVTPEVHSGFHHLAKANIGPWDPFGRNVPTVTIIPPSLVTDGSGQMVWSPMSYTSSGLSGSPLQYSIPMTPHTPPSLVSDLDSAAYDMSRSPSHSSDFSYESQGGFPMSRMTSSHSNHSLGSDNQDVYEQAPSFASQPSLDSVQSRKHRSSSSASQPYLSVPLTHDLRRSKSHQSNSSVSSSHSHHGTASHLIKTSDGKKLALLPVKNPDHGSVSRKQDRKTSFVCHECNDRPDGFRGEHELTRHIKLRHEATRTMWICMNPPDMPGFLDGCKHCEANKMYGAYYNAAQHVRRCHFSPIKRGRKSKNDTSAHTKHSSSRERNWPVMSDMKKFLCEVTVDRNNRIIKEVDAKSKTSAAPPAPLILDEDSVDFDSDDATYLSTDPSPDHDVPVFGSGSVSYPGYLMDNIKWAHSTDSFAVISPTHLLQGVSVGEMPVATPRYDHEAFSADMAFL